MGAAGDMRLSGVNMCRRYGLAVSMVIWCLILVLWSLHSAVKPSPLWEKHATGNAATNVASLPGYVATLPVYVAKSVETTIGVFNDSARTQDATLPSAEKSASSTTKKPCKLCSRRIIVALKPHNSVCPELFSELSICSNNGI